MKLKKQNNLPYILPTRNQEFYGFIHYDSYCEKLLDINYTVLYEKITLHSEINNIKDYALDRLLSRISANDIEIEKHNGYYGETIYSTRLSNEKFKEIECFVNKLNSSFTTDDLILETLNLEYGYILPILRNKTFEFKTIEVMRVKSNLDINYVKLDQKRISFYEQNPNKITVFCLENLGYGSYQLIDGNHRFTAASNSNLSEIKAVVAKSK